MKNRIRNRLEPRRWGLLMSSATASGARTATGSIRTANLRVIASDCQTWASPTSVAQLSSPTNRTGSAWLRLIFVNVKANVASIGSDVNRKKPTIHGEMNNRAERVSRCASLDLGRLLGFARPVSSDMGSLREPGLATGGGRA